MLSRAQAERRISAFGTKRFWRGFQIGCFTCHAGPDGEGANPNRAPVATNMTASTPVDVPVTIHLAARDRDRDPLTLRIVSQPAHGSVGLAGAAATYFPEPHYTGSDAFVFAAWDGAPDSSLGRVAVTVGGGNGAGVDLTGSWTQLRQRCRGEGALLRCTLVGRLLMENRGAARATASTPEILLSPDATSGSDRILRSARVRPVRAGRSRRMKLRLRLPAGTSAAGAYAIAAIDVTNGIAETDESNNMIVTGPLG